MRPPYRAVTFDCFGTLIDWKKGMRRVLEEFPSLRRKEERIDEILAARELVEQRLEAGEYRSYASILSDSIAEACRDVAGVQLTSSEQRAFAAGQLGWPAFPDTVEGLRALAGGGVAVGLLSNCDAQTLRLCAHKHLGVPISLFVSAEEVRSYKPALNHWGAALAAFDASPSEILHVSFTPEYDLNPAASMGFPLGFLRRYNAEEPSGLTIAHRGESLPELAASILA